MKATGIVRRMDDLGRIAIPKEIRRILHMEYGEPLAIYTDEDCIIFQKYHKTPIEDKIEDLIEHIQGYYECNDDFTQEQINEFKNALSTIQKAFKDE